MCLTCSECSCSAQNQHMNKVHVLYVSDNGLIQACQESMQLNKLVSSVSSYRHCYMGPLHLLQTTFILPCAQLTASSSPEELVTPSSLSLSVSVSNPLSSSPSSSPSSSLSPNSPPLPASDPDWTERHGLLFATEKNSNLEPELY